MKKEDLLNKLLNYLLEENKEAQLEHVPYDYMDKRRLLRGLMNLRGPQPIPSDILQIQDKLLTEERLEKVIVSANDLPTVADVFTETKIPFPEKLVLWQGDITCLSSDAIVNAANSKLLGCFIPCHGCIDNAIHSAAGIQLRLECNELMVKQGYQEPTGTAKITNAYNLPSKYIIHTIGPIIRGDLAQKDYELLASCYRSCLYIASENNLNSIAFCCISTGEFHFPKQKAAQIAVETVTDFLQTNKQIKKVIFNVFQQEDYEIYRQLLG